MAEDQESKGESRFEAVSRAQKSDSLVREFVRFLRDNKKWWLLPIILVFVVIGMLLLVSGTVGAPFIYALF